MSKRDDIIDAAIVEFGENSYDTASINRIIKTSGTSKGTFYHYFRDKKALYHAIIEKAMQIKQVYLAQTMDEVCKNEGDFFDALKLQIKAATDFARESPEYYRLGVMAVMDKSMEKDEVLNKYMPDVGSYFLEVIKAGMSQGDFSKRYPPEFVSRIVWYMMMNYYDILFAEGEMPTPEKVEQRLDMLFDFLKRGFA